MNTSNTFFIVGIAAGIASFALCLADMEVAQFATAFIGLASFAISERRRKINVR